MSELVEQFDAALRQINEDNPGELIDTRNAKGITDLPELEAFQEHYTGEAVKAIRRVYRRYAGGKPFADFSDAIERTKEDCINVLLPVAMKAFGDGVQMGQNNEPILRKYRFFKKMDQIFEAARFRENTDMFCLTAISSDYEMTERLTHYMHGAVLSLATSSGFIHMGADQASKVWDCWVLSLNSAAVALYACGHRIGQNMAEQDTLKGILSATEATEETE